MSGLESQGELSGFVRVLLYKDCVQQPHTTCKKAFFGYVLIANQTRIGAENAPNFCGLNVQGWWSVSVSRHPCIHEGEQGLEHSGNRDTGKKLHQCVLRAVRPSTASHA